MHRAGNVKRAKKQPSSSPSEKAQSSSNFICSGYKTSKDFRTTQASTICRWVWHQICITLLLCCYFNISCHSSGCFGEEINLKASGNTAAIIEVIKWKENSPKCIREDRKPETQVLLPGVLAKPLGSEFSISLTWWESVSALMHHRDAGKTVI